MTTIQRSARIRSLTSRLPGRDEADVVVTAIPQQRQPVAVVGVDVAVQLGVAERAVGAQVRAARRGRQRQ
jgi:hypothetical protein